MLTALTSAQAEETDNFTEFTDSATAAQVSLYHKTVSGSLVDLANEYEQNAIWPSVPSNKSLGTSR